MEHGMSRLKAAQSNMKKERARLQDKLRTAIDGTPPPLESRIGLAWGDYLRQIITLCVSALDAFFAFILSLWAPSKNSVPFRRAEPTRWSNVVRQELDFLHDYVHDEVVGACGVVRGNHHRVSSAALDLLEKECEPLKAAISLHFSLNAQSGNDGRLNGWMALFRHSRDKN